MIRFATEKDIPKIGDLLRQVCLVHHNGRPDIFKAGRKYSDEELAALLKDKDRPILVAVDDTDVVQGYCFCVYQQPADGGALKPNKTLYIDDLCVDENIRGQHIGSKLYDHVLAFAREQGCYNVTLNVWSCNEGAEKFYQSMGMKPMKTYMEVKL